MIVGVCGLGYSGSGAVDALLTEYSETQVFSDFEFVYTYMPDGIEDLEYHLMHHRCRYYDSDVAIRRFRKYIQRANTKRSQLRKSTNNQMMRLTDEYLSKLTQLTWNGFWSADMTHEGWLSVLFKIRIMARVYKLVFKTTKIRLKTVPDRKMYMSIMPENFYDASREYIRNILDEMGADRNKITVLDQPFAGDHPETSFKYFDEPKAIVIDRDPRDLYLVAKKIGAIVGRFMPTDDVETFVEYYKLIRKNIEKNEDSNNVLRIRFEDLIYEYDDTVATIERFLGIKDHFAPKSVFKPQVSINNTQLFLKFKDMKEDVEYIEKHLADCLYPFDKYPPIKHTGKSF